MFRFIKKSTNTPMLGVDFGSSTIKAVAVSGNAESFSIDTWAEIATPKGAIRDFQLQDVDRVSQAFKQLLIDRILSDNSLFQIEKWPHL